MQASNITCDACDRCSTHTGSRVARHGPATGRLKPVFPGWAGAAGLSNLFPILPQARQPKPGRKGSPCHLFHLPAVPVLYAAPAPVQELDRQEMDTLSCAQQLKHCGHPDYCADKTDTIISVSLLQPQQHSDTPIMHLQGAALQ